MSRKSVLFSVGLYFLTAVAFSIFYVVTNPFFAGLTAPTVTKIIGGAFLLFGGAGLLPILGWALYRLDLRYAKWPMLSWAFIGILLAYFFEMGMRLERDVQIAVLAKNVARSDAKLSCLDSQHADRFRSELGITERQILVYCGCISEAAAGSVTTDELTYIAENGKAPQPLHERAAQLGRPCRTLFNAK
jgi:hypothetical protein